MFMGQLESNFSSHFFRAEKEEMGRNFLAVYGGGRGVYRARNGLGSGSRTRNFLAVYDFLPTRGARFAHFRQSYPATIFSTAPQTQNYTNHTNISAKHYDVIFRNNA